MPTKLFEKGNPGRQKGSKNKITKTVRQTFLEVFNDLQSDPKVKLSAWAKQKPTDFYHLASKLIPTEINAEINNITVKVVRE